jgi:hypothetical protein
LKKRLTTVLVLIALASLSVAAVAQAHFLTTKRARSATFNVMKQECEKVPTCQGFAAGPCTRLGDHKVRCLGHIYGRNARTGPYDCHRQVTIQIYDGSTDRFYKTSERECEENQDHPVE